MYITTGLSGTAYNESIGTMSTYDSVLSWDFQNGIVNIMFK